jgi:hypothetical protein
MVGMVEAELHRAAQNISGLAKRPWSRLQGPSKSKQRHHRRRPYKEGMDAAFVPTEIAVKHTHRIVLELGPSVIPWEGQFATF